MFGGGFTRVAPPIYNHPRRPARPSSRVEVNPMTKVQLTPDRYINPRPTLLVGANVNTKPNFLVISAIGVACAKPPMMAFAVQHQRYTLKGILENLTFSINTPSVDLIKETDYCGIYSGAKVDKVAACGFKVFYGALKTAPMIEQCLLNLECRVAHVLDLGTHSFIIGEVIGAFADESCLTDGKPDPQKVRPITYSNELLEYRVLGEVVGRAFSIGRKP